MELLKKIYKFSVARFFRIIGEIHENAEKDGLRPENIFQIGEICEIVKSDGLHQVNILLMKPLKMQKTMGYALKIFCEFENSVKIAEIDGLTNIFL